MNTIYSEIIWDQLNLKDYKIHLEPWDKTENLIIDWVRDNTLEKVNEVLFGLSWIYRIVDDGWYDGQFYGLNQREKDKQYKHDDDKVQSDIIIHDGGILPSFLHVAIKSGMNSSELRFMANLLDVYYEKIPKSSCEIRRNEGDEL